MQTPNPLTDKDGEVRELTSEDMRRFRPASEVLPALLGFVAGTATATPEDQAT